MDLSRSKKAQLWIAIVLLVWIVALGLYWILKRPAMTETQDNVNSGDTVLPVELPDSSDTLSDSLLLPTSAYPDDKYAKEPAHPIRTILENMVIRGEHTFRGKVLQFLKTGFELQYLGIRTRNQASMELAGKRVDGFWLKVKTPEHEGWIFSPGTDYQNEK